MEPRSPDKRVNASPTVIPHVSDSGGEVRAADSEAAPIDNAALMKQLQESVARNYGRWEMAFKMFLGFDCIAYVLM